MGKLICNPLNLEYRYQIKKSPMGESVFREAADPTMVVFGGKYLLFCSMSGGFWYSDNLADWHFKSTPELPIYDYAPDVRVVRGQVVFSASRRNEPCSFYTSADPLNEPFQIKSTLFDFWDPDIFEDDDGRVYFYWGCTNKEPIWGIEIDPETFVAIGEKVGLIAENEAEHGWERKGENNKETEPTTELQRMIRQHVGNKPFIEGAFMTKHKGKYYLQYAAPGTECNIYADGVYIGDNPLGPFTYQDHNPFSSKPGGFITSAGHGNTFQDEFGNWWHVSTMRISVNENFERRIGLFPCGFDDDGVLYCNQNFADYPFTLPEGARDNLDHSAPEMFLLSYNKAVTASSSQSGYEPERSADENIRTWWAADAADADATLTLDLGAVCDVHAIQVNFADHCLPVPDIATENMHAESIGHRLIKTEAQVTEYLLEGSKDGEHWIILRDTRNQGVDLAHDFVVPAQPETLRYFRLSHMKLPMDGVPAVSGLRVFGFGCGQKPARVEHVEVVRDDRRNILLSWSPAKGADGYNVRYGLSPEKLYASWQVQGVTELDLSTVNAASNYYIAVDSFNACGVTTGVCRAQPIQRGTHRINPNRD